MIRRQLPDRKAQGAQGIAGKQPGGLQGAGRIEGVGLAGRIQFGAAHPDNDLRRALGENHPPAPDIRQYGHVLLGRIKGDFQPPLDAVHHQLRLGA